MIHKCRTYWIGDYAGDIDAYLREYSDEKNIEIKAVICQSCGQDRFFLRTDREECEPRTEQCPVCKNKQYQVRVGLLRRETHDVRHVFIGCRCTKCGTLDAPTDWRINYAPTDDMEKNI